MYSLTYKKQKQKIHTHTPNICIILCHMKDKDTMNIYHTTAPNNNRYTHTINCNNKLVERPQLRTQQYRIASEPHRTTAARSTKTHTNVRETGAPGVAWETNHRTAVEKLRTPAAAAQSATSKFHRQYENARKNTKPHKQAKMPPAKAHVKIIMGTQPDRLITKSTFTLSNNTKPTQQNKRPIYSQNTANTKKHKIHHRHQQPEKHFKNEHAPNKHAPKAAVISNQQDYHINIHQANIAVQHKLHNSTAFPSNLPIK